MLYAGIGGMKLGLHPIQRRIAEFHGTQCGYCTPGIVMSIYAQLRSHPSSTPDEIAGSLDGNLCRCTGYRPILDAAKSLSNSKGGCCRGEDSKSCPCSEKNSEGEDVVKKSTEKSISESDGLDNALAATNCTEPIFPPSLVHYENKDLYFSKSNYQWFQPITLAKVLELKSSFPEARIVVGNTRLGIEAKLKGLEFSVFINPIHVAELKVLNIESRNNVRGLRVGAAVSINALRYFVENLLNGASASVFESRGLFASKQLLTWFGSNQIRNIASVAGNIVTASPTSDLIPMLLAYGAVLTLVSAHGSRDCEIKDFLLGPKLVDLKPQEIVQSLFIPFTQPLEFVVPLKQARRRELDRSIVTAFVRVKLAQTSDSWKIQEFAAAFGGVGPTTVLATSTATSLIGKSWSKETFEEGYEALRNELTLPDDAPGGQVEYRTALVTSFLFKSFMIITRDLQLLVASLPSEEVDTSSSNLPKVLNIDPLDVSAIDNFVTSPKYTSRGEQQYSIRQGGLHEARPIPHALNTNDAVRSPVGDAVVHKSAQLQVSGEAIYTGDIKLPAASLHGALVTSTRAHAKILSVDTSAAEQCDGFVKYLSAKDVPGTNNFGPILQDEELFATEIVQFFGAVRIQDGELSIMMLA